jgi:hypothetical protein
LLSFERLAEQSVLNRTASLRVKRHDMAVKHKKSKKQEDKATLASITKEMARPRFAESARKEEEEANHRVMKHATYSERTGS